MQDVIAKWRQTISSPTTLVLLGSAIVLTTLSGPFGTHAALSFVSRLVFWGVALFLAMLIGIFLHYWVQARMPKSRRFTAEIVGTAVFTGFFSVLMLGWTALFTNYAFSGPAVITGWGIVLQVAAISLSLLAVRNFLTKRASDQLHEQVSTNLTDQDVVPFAAVSEPRLMRRLPEDQKSPILWLTSENHFVEVHTRKGCVRIRMRLADAIDEMEGVEGYCVHRSHWVAHTGIQSAQKVGGYWRLNLVNGQTVPVSRKYQPLLEDAGVLERLAIA